MTESSKAQTGSRDVLLANALLVDIDPPRVEQGSLHISDGLIKARPARTPGNFPGEVVDCGGAVVMPGLVNGHTHLYSALAAGMPPPRDVPHNFHEILKYIWWRLDRALDAGAVRSSALIGGLDALRCGTTTLIDHHASPNCIEGSLDLVEEGLRCAGARGVLCYEVTDRNGVDGRDLGLRETRRYIQKCKAGSGGRFAALAGAHASFTCGNETMKRLAGIINEFDTGVHIHVAEDAIDEKLCRRDYGIGLVDRLAGFNMLRDDSIFGHGTHLDALAFGLMKDAGTHLAHNTRSNMNNSVGYTPIGRVGCPRLLGTDGIGGNMFSEMQTAWFKAQDAHAGLTPGDIVEMLATNARRAGRSLGVKIGRLEAGFAADVVVTNYLPATPMNAENLAGHLIFAMGGQHVRHVIVGGNRVLHEQAFVGLDEREARRESAAVAKTIWRRMDDID